MQLFIRAEGNPSIGLGHIMRCYAFAETCQAFDIPVTFLCSLESSEFLKSRHGFTSAVINLDSSHCDSHASNDDKQSEHDANTLLDSVPELAKTDSVLLLDGYQFDYVYQSTLKNLGVKFAYFDDINAFYQHDQNNVLQHQADIIINGAESAHSLHYEKNAQQSSLCIGNDYLLLRREFHYLSPTPLSQRHTLLINFGGADVNNYSTQLLLALDKAGFASPVRVVSGAAFKHLDSLEHCLQNDLKASTMPVQHIHDAQEMASLMQHSRLAVCAAGGTQFELLACATPSILVVVAENQLPATQHAASQGWCDICEWQDQVDIDALVKQILALWQDESLIQSKYQRAVQELDKLSFKGAENMLNVLTELAHSTE
ncbi:UDP-2,4-diacetamido-2,4,6-trideoxy-beta-L-altropyranose hydrolase [Glaciecola sp. MF2-115]|uniref:UDP-2,4-diacetamido-2,4, 6-trideoxy-beta-L-altropyranose hydrolase n=1 Tax=Glaciecola sp. MF2-115 TaxID=3384827 RepID=UPI0039A06438